MENGRPGPIAAGTLLPFSQLYTPGSRSGAEIFKKLVIFHPATSAASLIIVFQYPFTACQDVTGNELDREKHTVLPEREARGAAATRYR